MAWHGHVVDGVHPMHGQRHSIAGWYTSAVLGSLRNSKAIFTGAIAHIGIPVLPDDSTPRILHTAVQYRSRAGLYTAPPWTANDGLAEAVSGGAFQFQFSGYLEFRHFQLEVLCSTLCSSYIRAEDEEVSPRRLVSLYHRRALHHPYLDFTIL